MPRQVLRQILQRTCLSVIAAVLLQSSLVWYNWPPLWFVVCGLWSTGVLWFVVDHNWPPLWFVVCGLWFVVNRCLVVCGQQVSPTWWIWETDGSRSRVGKLTKAFQVSHLGLFWMFSYHCLRLFSVINFYETSSYFFPVVKMRVTSRAPSSTWSKLIHKRISTKNICWFDL